MVAEVAVSVPALAHALVALVHALGVDVKKFIRPLFLWQAFLQYSIGLKAEYLARVPYCPNQDCCILIIKLMANDRASIYESIPMVVAY